jgi:ADP-ribose 1''-phosphate phosphatase
MGRIIYEQGNVFSAPAGSTFVHACNCVGVWGSGVAKAFKKYFPTAFESYAGYCALAEHNGLIIRGTSLTLQVPAGNVCCLFTSTRYGPWVDHPTTITQATHSAISHLMFNAPRFTSFHSPRINAGLFRVPWERTEEVIEDALKVYKENSWTVWTP